jgi:hypothetical protein
MTDTRLNPIFVVVLLGVPLIMGSGAILSLQASADSLGLLNEWTDYFIGVAWALALLMLVSVWPVSKQHKTALLILWFARIGVTLGAMLFYEGYYGLDAGHYFREGLREDDPLGLLTFGGGTDNMVALVALYSKVFPVAYHAIKVSCAYLGLIAVYLYYRAACMYRGDDNPALLYFLGLFPSILFWGSILGKDPITLMGIALFVYGITGFFIRSGPHFLLIGIMGILLAAFIRPWLGMLFVFPIALLLISARIGLVPRIILVSLMFVGGILALQGFADRFGVESRADLVETTEHLSQGQGEFGGGSSQEIKGGFQGLGAMVAFLPVGMFTALFRPLPGEIMNPFGLMAGLENALVLWLLFRAVSGGNLNRLAEPLVAWIAATIVLWAAVYGFVSYQNLGTAFRFRLQVLPLLLLLLIYLKNKSGTHVTGALWK